MKDMLSFLIARDTMHQNQWLAVLEEIEERYPVPSAFPQEEEAGEHSYAFLVQSDASLPADGRWMTGPSVDGKGEFSAVQAGPMGQEPELAPPPPQTGNAVQVRPGIARERRRSGLRARPRPGVR